MSAKRTDHNQAEIIQALRGIGASVQDLSQLGRGVPDLLVGYKERNYLIEIKNCDDRAPRLTESEESWIRQWRGQVAVITTIEDAITIVQDVELETAAGPITKEVVDDKGDRGRKSLGAGTAERARPSARKNVEM
jgi:hypothetical protein